MGFIVEVLLPSGESKQYEFTERHTIDSIKKEIFKQTDELLEEKRDEFELGLSESERLSIEFCKLLGYKECFQENVEQGLPIMLRLYKKKAPLTPLRFQKSASSPIAHQVAPTSPAVTPSSPTPSNNNSGVTPPTTPNVHINNLRSSMTRVSSPEILRLQNSLSSLEVKKTMKDLGGAPTIPVFPFAMGPPSDPNLQNNNNNTPNNNNESDSKEEGDQRRLSSSGPISTSPQMGRVRSSSSARIKSFFTKNKSLESLSIAGAQVELPHEDTAPDLSSVLMSRDDWASQEESVLLEQNQFGYHHEIGLKSLACGSFARELFSLEIPTQENVYEKFFLNNSHKNYFGDVEGVGPVFVSILKDVKKGYTRGLIRLPAQTHHVCHIHITGNSTNSLKNVLSKINQKIPPKSLKAFKSSVSATNELVKELNKFDSSHIVKTFKFGVLYCKDGQTTEEEWFSNEHGSDDFNEFLDLLGERITLNGWKNFRGGLDVNGNSTGKESYYTTHSNYEIMFHVSTLLPYFEADEQKIERKRHLGNDIVVIIFKEGNTLFPPSICKSVFNHVYIVVSKEDEESYRVELTIKDGVKTFGPPFPFPGLIHKSLIRDFLIVKMMNAEWAAYKSLDFAHKFKRTRTLQLSTLLEKYS